MIEREHECGQLLYLSDSTSYVYKEYKKGTLKPTERCPKCKKELNRFDLLLEAMHERE